MLLNRAVIRTACLAFAPFSTVALAQDVPTPPPPGVTSVAPRQVPAEPAPSLEADSTLPVLPENPIQLEAGAKSVTESAPLTTDPAPTPMSTQEAAAQKPVKPVGPVYYFPPTPPTYPYNVMLPPPMHVPNSPYVEDLSVAGEHGRYPYYSYRRPWYTPGRVSRNVTIVW